MRYMSCGVVSEDCKTRILVAPRPWIYVAAPLWLLQEKSSLVVSLAGLYHNVVNKILLMKYHAVP